MPVEGTGLHRIWYVGGRWAYASGLLDGFSDYILITIDMKDPKKPVMAGKYWLPGMNAAAGEKANWPSKNGRFGLHHAIIHDDVAYCSWRDACLAVVDVKDKAKPKAPCPQGLGAAVRRRHAQCAAAGQANLLVVVDETRARQSGGRVQADLDLRQPGQVQPDQHLDLPCALGQGLSQGRRPFWAAQRPRKPTGQLRQRRADLRHLPERRAPRSTISRTSFGPRRSPPSFLRRRPSGWTRGPTGRSCCIRPTSSSTRTRSATLRISTPASISSNTRAEAAPMESRR